MSPIAAFNPTMAATVFQLVFMCGVATAAGDPVPSVPGWQERVEALIRQLGDDSFARREAATTALLAEGEKVVPLLDKARRNADLETARRIDRIRYRLKGYADDLMRFLKSESLSEASMAAFINQHQPGSGELLVQLSAHPGQSLSRAAARWFCQTWNTGPPAQLDAYFKSAIHARAKHRPRYPRGVPASIETGYELVHGWDGLPRDLHWQTRTSHYVDGRLHGEARVNHNLHPAAVTARIDTGRLALGEHTLRIEIEYEFVHASVKHRGAASPAEFTFTVVPDDGDRLLAPADADLEREVRQGLAIAEYDHIRFAPAVGFDARFKADPWEPQITWHDNNGKHRGLHMPEWALNSPLPVDLCFDVSIRDVKTRKSHPGRPLVLRKGQTGLGWFVLRDVAAFCGDRTGFVEVELQLTPSRALALSNPRIASYFGGTIVSPPLRAKIIDRIPGRGGP